jgi:hypothetical protein
MSTARLFQNNSEQKFSTQMQAVLLILDADPYLKEHIEPFIDFRNETISWEPILKMSFGSGHRAAVSWMYGLWTDELRPGSNPFDAALSMGPGLQLATLKAMAFRWGLAKS